MDNEIIEFIKQLNTFSLDQLNAAFDIAENETAHEFNSQTCSMTNQSGVDECPICYFRSRVKHHLSALPSQTRE